IVVALHIAGAIKHHFVLRDDTLRRMLPVRRTTVGAVAAALIAAPAAHGAAAGSAFSLVPAQSSLTYSFTQAGAENQGRFRSFAASFDPSAGRLEVVIDMRSFDTGDRQRNDILGGKDLFDVTQYPQSRFIASRIAKTASGYEAMGALTLRGVTRNITVPFTWRTATAQGHPVGHLS